MYRPSVVTAFAAADHPFDPRRHACTTGASNGCSNLLHLEHVQSNTFCTQGECKQTPAFMMRRAVHTACPLIEEHIMPSDSSNRRSGPQLGTRRHAGREGNAFKAMSRLLPTPPPLASGILACGSQLTRRWVRDGFNGYAPGMAGHLISTYHGHPQDCAWTLERRRLCGRLRPGTVTVVTDGHDGLGCWMVRSRVHMCI